MHAEGDAELDIVANALTAEGRGRLYKALVLKQLAQSVSVNQGGSQFSGQFSVSVTLRTGTNVDDVKKIVFDELARVTKENLTDKEIARFVAATEASAVYRLEGLNARANQLQAYNHYLGDPGYLAQDLAR